MPHQPHLNRIGTAVPAHEAHATYLAWAGRQLAREPRKLALLKRMIERAGIEHRWSVLPPSTGGDGQLGKGAFYEEGRMPPTSARMALYAQEAPTLALAAVAALGPVTGVTHLVVASCTGFVAPGIDQIIARRLGLSPHVERTLVGFMGCYAAVAALRTAHHIVRSEPAARVLVITVELSSLHLQPATDLEPILAMMQFGDGAAAALAELGRDALELSGPFANTLPDSDDLIRWVIGDTGFEMHLSGAVPARIAAALAAPGKAGLPDAATVDSWAVHAGGRSVLDAVEHGLSLPADALGHSREVLRTSGNMSSATLMFVLARILESGAAIDNGIAIAFGPGLAAEGIRYRSAR
jgi:predicted naringenin-chalcone synthase